MNNNKFIGSIPSSINKLKNLYIMYIYYFFNNIYIYIKNMRNHYNILLINIWLILYNN